MKHFSRHLDNKSVPREKKILFWLLLGLAVLAFLVAPLAMHSQERTNTFYASQYSGADVAAKMTNAMASCNSTFTCVIVLDSILGGWPQGAGVAPCTQCVIMDYRTTGVLKIFTNGISGSVNVNGVSFVGGAMTGLLGTIALPINNVILGDGGGSSTFNGNSAFTSAWTFNVPNGNTGTVVVGSLTTTAATSDSPTIQGAKLGAHCQLQPTNASAATNIATTFVSATGLNSITVTHVATAGMIYSVTCTNF